MQTSTELKGLLNRIDHKSYPAYKDTKGIYQFPGYQLYLLTMCREILLPRLLN